MGLSNGCRLWEVLATAGKALVRMSRWKKLNKTRLVLEIYKDSTNMQVTICGTLNW